jgi:gamma-glutamyltranspeptidase/glutathione hydrolase
MTRMPERGWEAVTIPGAVSGWVELSQRFGRLPFADLFEPAIRYARAGFLVSPVIAAKWALAALDAAGLGFAEHFRPARPGAGGRRGFRVALRWPPRSRRSRRRAARAFYRASSAAMVAHATRTAHCTRSRISRSHR